MMSDEKRVLIRHLRRHHPNLPSDSINGADWQRAIREDRSLGWVAALPTLPRVGLSDVPMVVLSTVRAAAHTGLYFYHPEDDCEQGSTMVCAGLHRGGRAHVSRGVRRDRPLRTMARARAVGCGGYWRHPRGCIPDCGIELPLAQLREHGLCREHEEREQRDAIDRWADQLDQIESDIHGAKRTT